MLSFCSISLFERTWLGQLVSPTFSREDLGFSIPLFWVLPQLQPKNKDSDDSLLQHLGLSGVL